jgi:hypothetical protein
MRYQVVYDKLIISDIRFGSLKEDSLYSVFENLINSDPFSTDHEIKKSLFIKLSKIFVYIDLVLPELKSPPIINYSLPFESFPKTTFENDIIKNLFEDICVTFRSSLDILTHLLYTKIKSLPALPKKPNGELDPNGKYEGFKRSSKLKVDTLKILKKDAPALYAIFQKHNDWIKQLCDYRDTIIHKRGHIDISYWTKTQEKQSITWITPMLDNEESIELFTIKIRAEIIEFYKEILTEYDNLTPQTNPSAE